MTRIIKQPAGLGDILFLQKAAHEISKRDKCNILWPVTSQYINIKDYIPYFTFVDINYDFFQKDEYNRCPQGTIQNNVICTDGASRNGCGIMTSKYDLLGIDCANWADGLKFNRNLDKERSLFYDVLGLNDETIYCVFNNKIGSAGHESTWNNPRPTDRRVVDIKEIDGFSVFDWCMVLERAEEFQLMETCFCYLIEVLETRAKKYMLYHRSESSSLNFQEFSKIYKKPIHNFGRETLKRIG